MFEQEVTVNLLRLKNVPIYEQLQIEEALLRIDENNWFIVNEGSPPAIVMGISGKKEVMVNTDFYNKNPIPLIKRFSGGGTVIVDENTIFTSLICNSKSINISCCPKKILNWTHHFYAPIFPKTDFKVQENDYTFGNKKFGGNAQYLRKNRWLHHSTLLWDFHPENMNYLKTPPKMPKYRNERPHNEFLSKMSLHLEDKNVFLNSLLMRIQQVFKVTETTHENVVLLKEKQHRKSTSLLT